MSVSIARIDQKLEHLEFTWYQQFTHSFTMAVNINSPLFVYAYKLFLFQHFLSILSDICHIRKYKDIILE